MLYSSDGLDFTTSRFFQGTPMLGDFVDVLGDVNIPREYKVLADFVSCDTGYVA
jgi:hypothetical protein